MLSRTGVWARSKELGIHKLAGPVRIICDAYSGACNPDELDYLLELKQVELRTRDSLHAKVFITPTSVITGSANASANGLGQEGGEAKNLEAVAFVAETKFRYAAKKWFQRIWRWDSRPVTDETIEEIRPIWKRRRRHRPANTSARSLFAVFRDTPEWFKDRNIRVVAYDGCEPSPDVMRKFNAIAADLYNPRDLRGKGDLPFFEDNGKWDIAPGEYVLHFDIDVSRRRASFQNFWRVRDVRPFYRVAGKRIVLCDLVTEFKGLRLIRAEAKALERPILDYVARGDFKKDNVDNLLNIPLVRLADILK